MEILKHTIKKNCISMFHILFYLNNIFNTIMIDTFVKYRINEELVISKKI